jgi:uncharacterized protein
VIIDCHAHFEPRMLETELLIAKLDRVGVDRVVLIPTMTDPLPASPERLLWAARKLSQSRAGRLIVERIHRATLTPEGDLRLGNKVFGIYARPDNESVARVVKAHPTRFAGWIFLNPRNNPAACDELERWRTEPGMIGLKLHPHWHDYRTEIAFPLFRRAEELNLPVLIHLGFGPRGDIEALLTKFPRLKVIAAHAGFPLYRDLWRVADRFPNLRVDLSSPYIDESLARNAVRVMGVDRCLYGTDAPYGSHETDGTFDYGNIKGWVERMPISSADRDRVFGGNFSELIAS